MTRRTMPILLSHFLPSISSRAKTDFMRCSVVAFGAEVLEPEYAGAPARNAANCGGATTRAAGGGAVTAGGCGTTGAGGVVVGGMSRRDRGGGVVEEGTGGVGS